jgi:hypothetical protein
MINRILQAIEHRIDRDNAQKRAINLQIEIVGQLIDRRWAVATERDDKAMMNTIVSVLHDAAQAETASDLATLKNCEVRLNELR